MTRGLYPPDTLSKDDVRTLQDLRRDIYSSAMLGAGFGCTSGFVFHTGLQMAKKYGLLNSKLNKNTAMLSVLGCGALGMFLGATKTGKESVHNLHPIFQIGAVPKQPNELERVGYGKTVQQAQLGRNNNNNSLVADNNDAVVDRQKLEEIAMMRRSTLKNRIEKGHGISDSHGGNWYRDPEEVKNKVDINDLKQAQLLRRQSLAERITKGSGLSDSHGGHWYRETGK